MCWRERDHSVLLKNSLSVPISPDDTFTHCCQQYREATDDEFVDMSLDNRSGINVTIMDRQPGPPI